jgi:alpha/beta hydrolase family protein
VMGLAYATPRDLGSFLRYSTRDDFGNPNPLARSADDVGMRRAYALGISSTGMYMRDYVYLGFNEDESSRKVWDVVWTHIPGSHRLFANVEFADPDTYSREDDRQDFISGSATPTTYAVMRDPITGVTDGILKRPATDPLIVQTNTENEFWSFRASLDVADGLGRPVPTPDTVRFYLLSNFQHGGTLVDDFPGKAPLCRYPTNPNYAGPTLRAIFTALDAWADEGVPPPASSYPRLEDGTLVTVDQARETFPKIPGVMFPKAANGLNVLDFGPEFKSDGGRILHPIPKKRASYTIFVPKTDADGLDLAGIRPMEVRVPLGTNMGWNIRNDSMRSPHLCGLTGSFIAFAKTSAERMANGDPRLSLEERYRDHAGYVAAVKAEAAKMVAAGWLLPEDATRFVNRAEASNVLK